MKDFNINNEKINTGFKVPEGYFEQFESRMLNQLTTENEPKVISLWKQKRVWMTSVAAVLLISIALPVYFSMNNTTKNSTVEDETIETYLAMQSSLTNYEIATELTNEDFASLEESLALNDDAVELYLEENYQNVDLYLNE
jgi:anti-sigma-K factor RskA